jgi:hypothetical protein
MSFKLRRQKSSSLSAPHCEPGWVDIGNKEVQHSLDLGALRVAILHSAWRSGVGIATHLAAPDHKLTMNKVTFCSHSEFTICSFSVVGRSYSRRTGQEWVAARKVATDSMMTMIKVTIYSPSELVICGSPLGGRSFSQSTDHKWVASHGEATGCKLAMSGVNFWSFS